MSDVTIRPLVAGEFDLFDSYGPSSTSGVGLRSRTFAELAAAGQYRPEWLWVATRPTGPGGADTVVARAAFWGPADSSVPFSVDFFDFRDDDPHGVEVAAELLRAAYAVLGPPGYTASTGNTRPDYHLFLPADWRDHADARDDVARRVAAAQAAGLEFFVERVNERWTPELGLPPRPGRLRFTEAPPEQDALIARVLADLTVDTLDAYARRDVDRYGVERAAEVTIEECADFPGGRGLWRLAWLPEDGAGDRPGSDPVGIVMPTSHETAATLAYIGVVPRHRGHGYVDDLVIEALHLFVERGHQVVADATDVANAPMIAAFARVGYQVSGRRIVML